MVRITSPPSSSAAALKILIFEAATSESNSLKILLYAADEPLD